MLHSMKQHCSIITFDCVPILFLACVHNNHIEFVGDRLVVVEVRFLLPALHTVDIIRPRLHC